MQLKPLPWSDPATQVATALIFTVLVSIVPASTSRGQSLEPFESPRISETQWRTYYFEVESAHRDSVERLDAELLIQFRDSGAATIWTFTQLGHPAHPGWVTRRVVDTAGQASVRQVGYFAGDEDAFFILFQKFLQQNKVIEGRLNE